MAIRFQTAGDYLFHNTPPAYNIAFAIMAWVYNSVDLNANSDIFGIGLDSNNGDTLRFGGDGTTLRVSMANGGTFTGTNGTNTTVATWYHMALVRESATAIKCYLNGAQDINHTAGNTAGRSAATSIRLGSSPLGQRYNGRMMAFKAWDTSLTAAEVAQEMQTIRPQRFANLYYFVPILDAVTDPVQDLSGNGRDFSHNGSNSDEAPAPVSWGAPVLPLTPWPWKSLPLFHRPTRVWNRRVA